MDNRHHFDPPVTRRLLDADEFQRMVEAGVFAEDDRKIELDEGEIVVAPIDGGAHLSVGERLSFLWYPRIAASTDLQARLKLYVPGGMRLGERTVRGPDAMLAAPGSVQARRWPTADEVLLAVEFSDTTLKYDDGRKRAQYARAGVRELWIVRVEKADVRVCRGPRDDGSWDEAALHSGAEILSPLAAPELAIRAEELFG